MGGGFAVTEPSTAPIAGPSMLVAEIMSEGPKKSRRTPILCKTESAQECHFVY